MPPHTALTMPSICQNWSQNSPHETGIIRSTSVLSKLMRLKAAWLRTCHPFLHSLGMNSISHYRIDCLCDNRRISQHIVKQHIHLSAARILCMEIISISKQELLKAHRVIAWMARFINDRVCKGSCGHAYELPIGHHYLWCLVMITHSDKKSVARWKSTCSRPMFSFRLRLPQSINWWRMH